MAGLLAMGLALLAAQEDRTIPFQQVHGAGVRSIAFSPDLKRFATGGVDSSLRVWDVETGRELLVLAGHGGGVPALTFSADGAKIVSGGGDGTLGLWDSRTGKPLGSFAGHSMGIYSLALSPDGTTLVSGDGEGRIRFTDVALAKERRVLQAPVEKDPAAFRTTRTGIYALAFSPDGRAVASVEPNGWFRVWQSASGEQLLAVKAQREEVHAAAYSPDGRLVATAGTASAVALWDATLGRQAEVLWPIGGFHSVAFSPDGMLLAAGESMEGGIYLWEVATGKGVRVLAGHEGGVLSIAFSPDGRRLLSGGTDRSVRVWDLRFSRDRKEKDPKTLLDHLSGEDVPRAYLAIWSMAELGEAALPLLRERLKNEPVSEARVRELLLRLDDDDLALRDEAMGELTGLGTLVEGHLRKVSESEGTPEQKARVEPLLKALADPMIRSGAARDRLRALQAVERMAGKGAEDLLRAVSEGSPSGRERALARGALARRGAR